MVEPHSLQVHGEGWTGRGDWKRETSQGPRIVQGTLCVNQARQFKCGWKREDGFGRYFQGNLNRI